MTKRFLVLVCAMTGGSAALVAPVAEEHPEAMSVSPHPAVRIEPKDRMMISAPLENAGEERAFPGRGTAENTLLLPERIPWEKYILPPESTGRMIKWAKRLLGKPVGSSQQPSGFNKKRFREIMHAVSMRNTEMSCVYLFQKQIIPLHVEYGLGLVKNRIRSEDGIDVDNFVVNYKIYYGLHT
uniref:Uncharacterized protein n=1 Tax=Peronospora matthiolae TaxID=2874970 RepID=A0AAV1UDF5_9STRA